MTRKIKYGKIAVVIFLTVLIWVWADLAQERDTTIPSVTVEVSKSTRPDRLASFKQDDTLVSSVTVQDVKVRGSASKITQLQTRLNQGLLELEFFLVPEDEGMTEPGEHSLALVDFLKQSKSLRELGLTVESCEPEKLTVHVMKLVQRDVAVECIDENGITREAESIEPATVNTYVPADMTVTAKVQLTSSEMGKARAAVVEKTPFIELPGGRRRPLNTKVKLTMPPADVLKECQVSATLGFCFSQNLQGNYTVQVENPSDLATVLIRATPAAEQAYKDLPYQITLNILDDDPKTADGLKRAVQYNFPEEYVRRNEIELSQAAPSVQARFKLIPVSAGPE
jgi:hypothetical protein